MDNGIIFRILLIVLLTFNFSSYNDDDSSVRQSLNGDYSGTFEFNTSSIEFHDFNYWTANFDFNLILAGEFECSTNSNKLIISANRTEFGLYNYQLIKD